MREGKPRLAIFGDSHYACLKQADVQGLVDLSALEVEYWGHVGGRFRNLEFRGGAIHPTDDFTAQRFAKFNEKGRLFLPASDFDVILLAGARTYLARSFLALLRLRAQGPFVSRGLMSRILQDNLRDQAGFRLGAALAATSSVRVLLAPIAFYTEYPADLAQMTPEMLALAPDIVPFLWEEVARITTEAGMTLIPQPAGTITNWLWTRAEYAVAGYLAKQDHEHHNAAYGALVLTAMLDHLRRVVLPDAAPAGMLPPG
ncbi:MAG: hypothetical protein B7Z31_08035 [Rhodobacterales bacterium 12-65-15]|nr:MAG: hypothetical protein B7Z31_08035 [Rhodobacterales bacterium 12-65-15]